MPCDPCPLVFLLCISLSRSLPPPPPPPPPRSRPCDGDGGVVCRVCAPWMSVFMFGRVLGKVSSKCAATASLHTLLRCTLRTNIDSTKSINHSLVCNATVTCGRSSVSDTCGGQSAGPPGCGESGGDNEQDDGDSGLVAVAVAVAVAAAVAIAAAVVAAAAAAAWWYASCPSCGTSSTTLTKPGMSTR